MDWGSVFCPSPFMASLPGSVKKVLMLIAYAISLIFFALNSSVFLNKNNNKLKLDCTSDQENSSYQTAFNLQCNYNAHNKTFSATNILSRFKNEKRIIFSEFDIVFSNNILILPSNKCDIF